MKQLQIQHL